MCVRIGSTQGGLVLRFSSAPRCLVSSHGDQRERQSRERLTRRDVDRDAAPQTGRRAPRAADRVAKIFLTVFAARSCLLVPTDMFNSPRLRLLMGDGPRTRVGMCSACVSGRREGGPETETETEHYVRCTHNIYTKGKSLLTWLAYT